MRYFILILIQNQQFFYKKMKIFEKILKIINHKG